ncbi:MULTISPECIES: helix-turn-helix domain-containing protein [unclassified Lacrimispora]|uniref:helix-turn-helix domain-containing protein n=1 Tax=unclassified Lacrimispora TaxID=2719232 RepID=UPI0037700600
MKIKLRSLRIKQHMSMEDLAIKALISKSTISRIESGDMIPSVDILCRLCVALGVTLNDMVDCKGGFYDD